MVNVRTKPATQRRLGERARRLQTVVGSIISSAYDPLLGPYRPGAFFLAARYSLSLCSVSRRFQTDGGSTIKGFVL